MTENTVLPLINTVFEPGNARKAAESFADRDFREIAEHMGVSLNTVKHYLTDIFNKLHVKKRDELKNFNIDCFVVHEDIYPTVEWEEQIIRALQTMDFFYFITL